MTPSNEPIDISLSFNGMIVFHCRPVVYGVFHSHGGTPIAGWFMKNPIYKWMITIASTTAVPPFQETSIWIYLGEVMKNSCWFSIRYQTTLA